MAYLVMEYLPGITLRDLLTEHKVLTTEQTLDIMEAVLGGLAAAHKAGIVHRDLKPENVLLADDGRIKIGDFGLARAASANTATGAALLGTIAYLSPELVTRGVARHPQRHLRGRHHDVRDARRRAAVQGRPADADRVSARERDGARPELEECQGAGRPRRDRAVGHLTRSGCPSQGRQGDAGPALRDPRRAPPQLREHEQPAHRRAAERLSGTGGRRAIDATGLDD